MAAVAEEEAGAGASSRTGLSTPGRGLSDGAPAFAVPAVRDLRDASRMPGCCYSRQYFGSIRESAQVTVPRTWPRTPGRSSWAIHASTCSGWIE